MKWPPIVYVDAARAVPQGAFVFDAALYIASLKPVAIVIVRR